MYWGIDDSIETVVLTPIGDMWIEKVHRNLSYGPNESINYFFDM